LILSSGIVGLDNLLGGGIPEGHIVAVVGSFGTGKTTLGLHFIYEGLKNGENCLAISFDEDEESILENAKSIGMDFKKFGNNVQIVRLDATEVKRSMERLESDIPEVIRSSNVTRVVIDTISVLETLFDEIGRYNMLSKLRDILKRFNVTAIITTEADRNNTGYSKYGILEYICDGSICLQIIKRMELEEPTLGLQVVKMRRVKHSRKVKPYIISEEGIKVHEEAEIF